MNPTSAARPGGTLSLGLLAPLATPQAPVRSPVVRRDPAILRLTEPTSPGPAATVCAWLGEIRRDNAVGDRVLLLLWVASWGALILAFTSRPG